MCDITNRVYRIKSKKERAINGWFEEMLRKKGMTQSKPGKAANCFPIIQFYVNIIVITNYITPVHLCNLYHKTHKLYLLS